MISHQRRYIKRNAVLSAGGISPTFKLWSNPDTWVPGSTNAADVPQAGQSFEIGADSIIYLDVKTPALGDITWSGQVYIPNGLDTSIDCHSIMGMSSGKLIFADGNPGQYVSNFAIRFRGGITGTVDRYVTPRTGQQPVKMGFNNPGMDRSIMLDDGFEIKGGPPVLDHHWRLADHAQINTNSIKIRGTAKVKQGDKFVISTTDYYGMSDNSEMTVAQDSNGDTITFTTNFVRFHWGKMQWVTKTADREGHLSLVDEGWRPSNDAPYKFDMAAHVIRLNRSIVLDGSLDGNLGGRFMVHGRTGILNIDGWEFAYTGVKGIQQWYGGVHHHMVSYVMPDGPNAPSSGEYMGGSLEESLCKNHYVQNCSVHHSQNRGHVPHGANGVTYDHNVYYYIVASALFGEEGSFRKCVINENHVIKVIPSVAPYILQIFDQDSDDTVSVLARASAFWLTNPDNTVTNNSAGDCITGFWNAYTNRNFDVTTPAPPQGSNFNDRGCFGLSKNISFAPGGLPVLLWKNNECYANKKKAILTDFAQGDEAGGTASDAYPHPDSAAYPTTHVFSEAKMWKSIQGYQNRVKHIEYRNWSGADVCGAMLNGATQAGSIAPNGLVITQSLNVTTRPPGASTYDALGQSYNGSLVFPGWIVVNFKMNEVGIDDEQGGTNGDGLLTARSMFKMWSEYLFPMTVWGRRSPGVELLNSDYAYRTPPSWMSFEAPYTNIGQKLFDGSFAGSMKQYDTYLGATAPGKTWTYNVPFCTYGATSVTEALPLGKNNGVLVNETFFGVGEPLEGGTRYDDITYPLTDIKSKRDTRRLDPTTLSEVGHWTCPAGTAPGGGPISTHNVGFTHFPVMEGGVYKSLVADIPQTYWKDIIFGSRIGGKSFVRGVPFTGAKTAKVCGATNNNDLGADVDYYATPFAVQYDYARRFTAAASLADLIAGAPNRFWQDKPNNYVWYKYTGGYNGLTSDQSIDEYDYAKTSVVVSGN